MVANTRANEYLVAWDGEDDAGALVNEEDEVYVQRLGPDGAEIGGDDVRVSTMGADGNDRQSVGAGQPILAATNFCVARAVGKLGTREARASWLKIDSRIGNL